MTKPLGCAVAGLLAVVTPAAAQVTITGVVQTNLVVSAAGGSTQTLPAGTVLTSHQLGASGQCGGSGSSASLSVTLSGTAVTFDTFAASWCAGGASAGGAILLTLSAPTPTAGSLHVDDGMSSLGSYSVDIGNDGSVELSGAYSQIITRQTAAFSLEVGPAGVQVLVSAGSSAAGVFYTSASTDLTLSFETGGIVVPEGSPCGPALAARYYLATGLLAAEEFDFDATSSPVTPYAFFVLGVQPLNLVIPPLSCVLRTNIVVPLLTAVNPAGEASFHLPVPPGIGPINMRVQYLAATIDPGTGATVWRTSEAIVVGLP